MGNRKALWLSAVALVALMIAAGSIPTVCGQDSHHNPVEGLRHPEDNSGAWEATATATTIGEGGGKLEDAANQGEILSLTKKLKTADLEQQRLRQELGAWATSAKHVDAEMEELKGQVASLNGKLDRALEEKQAAEDRAAALESQFKDLKKSASKVAGLERSAAEQTKLVSRLQAEIQELKTKEAGSAEELEKYENAIRRAEAAELQVAEVSTLLEGLKGQVRELQNRADAAEKSLASQSVHSEKLSLSSEDTKRKLAEVEQTLKIAEAAMLAAEADAAAKGKALLQAYRQWLPPWAAIRLAELQTKASVRWAEHGQPAVAAAHVQLKTRAAALNEWSKPHLSSAAAFLSKVAVYFGQAAEPAMEFAKEQHARLWPVVSAKWASMVETVGPHVETARIKLNEAKVATRAFVGPHLQTARVVSEPYIELVREKCKPAVDVVIEKVGPHVETARKHLDPHMKSVVLLYEQSVIAARDLHQQIGGKIRKHMLSYELTSPYARDNVVGFLAAALFLLPLAAMWIIISPYRRSAPKTLPAKSTANVTHRHRKHHRRSSNPARTSSS